MKPFYLEEVAQLMDKSIPVDPCAHKVLSSGRLVKMSLFFSRRGVAKQNYFRFIYFLLKRDALNSVNNQSDVRNVVDNPVLSLSTVALTGHGVAIALSDSAGAKDDKEAAKAYEGSNGQGRLQARMDGNVVDGGRGVVGLEVVLHLEPAGKLFHQRV